MDIAEADKEHEYIVRDIASGGASEAQLAAEVKSLSKEEREELLSKASLPVHITPDHALAMKASHGISYGSSGGK